MKYVVSELTAEVAISRTSHEVRGLKYEGFFFFELVQLSHLTRGAWIEIGLQLLPHS